MKTKKIRTLDDSTRASTPGKIQLSHKKLRILRPDLYGIRGVFNWFLEKIRLRFAEKIYIKEQLFYGDSRAAVVVSVKPLLVAAYTDELDCVAVLRFPDNFSRIYNLSPGSRLLSMNTYKKAIAYDADLIIGPNKYDRWTGFHPLIADFLSDDSLQVETRKQEITEREWELTYELGQIYLTKKPGIARDGRPVYAATPAR